MTTKLTVTFLVDDAFVNEDTTAQELADDIVADANWGDGIEGEAALQVLDASFPKGHRVDADLVDGARRTIEQIDALGEEGPLGGAYVVVAMDAVDLGDHPGLRKRAWLVDGFGVYRDPA